MGERQSKDGSVSLQTYKRLPNYYNYLRGLSESEGESYIAAPAIAKELGLNEVQVRKDLAAVSRSPGKPRRGFEIRELLDSIGECLGYNNNEEAVLIGAGRLGRALLSYKGFEEHGVRIVAAFDRNEDIAGTIVNSKRVFAMDELAPMLGRMRISIGIIAVPAQQAQMVCDTLVQSGVTAIWNFAPIHLYVPDGVLVKNENMAAQLAILSRRLVERPNGQ